MNEIKILLPGGGVPLKFLTKSISISPRRILVVGGMAEIISKRLHSKYKVNIEQIVENYESLLNANIILDYEENVIVKLMDFERTDYESDYFDMIYSQGSISGFNRKKIVKELKRILKPGGVFAVTEIVKKEENLPGVMNNLLESAGLNPLLESEAEKYYEDRNFTVIAEKSLPDAMKDYYQAIRNIFGDVEEELSDSEKSYYKKIIHRISHEGNVFLKYGGDRYISLKVLIMKLVD
jgi:SAM-dependent methyltransferase